MRSLRIDSREPRIVAVAVAVAVLLQALLPLVHEIVAHGAAESSCHGEECDVHSERPGSPAQASSRRPTAPVFDPGPERPCAPHGEICELCAIAASLTRSRLLPAGLTGWFRPPAPASIELALADDVVAARPHLSTSSHAPRAPPLPL